MANESNMIRLFVLCIAVLTLISGMVCETVTHKSCPGDESKNCKINQVRVVPCKEADKNPPGACRLKKKTVARIEVDFTPEFDSANIHTGVYWAGAIDLPLAGMEKDGCKTTTCPTKSGTQQTYTYDLNIASYFPLSTYNVKYVLEGNDKDEQHCCFIFPIKIIR